MLIENAAAFEQRAPHPPACIYPRDPRHSLLFAAAAAVTVEEAPEKVFNTRYYGLYFFFHFFFLAACRLGPLEASDARPASGECARAASVASVFVLVCQ
jgi:hypothetical protein